MSQALSNLAVGSNVKFGSYSVNGETAQPIVWTIVAKNHTGYPDNSVTLHTSEIIDLRCFDAKEPNNSNSSRVAYGNNYYSVSNIDQWLNKNADGGSWYVAAHSADSAPDTAANTRVGTQYAARPGFLNAFTANEKNAILSTTIRVVKPTTDGGSYEDVVRKVFLPSITEIGLGNENNIAEGTAWGYYTTATARAAYATAQCYSNTQSSSKASSQTTNWQWWLRTSYATQTHYVRLITSSGGTSSGYAYSGQYGIRPALNLSNTLNVSDSADSDGCYTFEWSGSTDPDPTPGGNGTPAIWVGGTETYTENETRNVEVSLGSSPDVDYLDELVSLPTSSFYGGFRANFNILNGYLSSDEIKYAVATRFVPTAGSSQSTSLTFRKALTNVRVQLYWENINSQGTETDVTNTISVIYKGNTIFEKTGTIESNEPAKNEEGCWVLKAEYVIESVAEGDVLTCTCTKTGNTTDSLNMIYTGYQVWLASDPITFTETVPVQKTRSINKPVSSIYAGVTATVPKYTETTTTEDVALSSATFTDFFSADNTGTTGTSATGLKWAAQSGGGLKLTFGNYGINSSTSMTTFTAQRDLTNVVIKGLYYTESNYDKITLTVAGTTVLNAVSGTSSSLTQRWSGSLSKGQTIALKFVKDSSQSASSESSTYFTLSCDPYQKTTINKTQTGTETKLVDKKIVKGYIGGPDGKARLFFGENKPAISYSGEYTISDITNNGQKYKLYTLTSSGSLTLGKSVNSFLTGGGGGGYSATHTSTRCQGGFGGGGGWVSTQTLDKGDYVVIIGSGGVSDKIGGDTSIKQNNTTIASALGGNHTSTANYVGSGGSGGGVVDSYNPSSSSWSSYGPTSYYGNVSTIPFGITSLEPHCAGGSAGRIMVNAFSSSGLGTYYYGGIGGSNGGQGKYHTTSFVEPAEKGGGSGGIPMEGTGYSATFYGSAGGGGGTGWYTDWTSSKNLSDVSIGKGGTGYQGVVYLLIPA